MAVAVCDLLAAVGLVHVLMVPVVLKGVVSPFVMIQWPVMVTEDLT